MSRVTLKSSTIFISAGAQTRVYRSVDEVPAPLRKKLEQSTNGINSATILIADKRGREEILRAIRGGSNLKTRVTKALRSEPEPAPRTKPLLRWLRGTVELLIPPVTGLLTWLFFRFK